MPTRHPQELTSDEGLQLLEEIRSFGDPLMIFTGGDPLKRPDIYDLLDHSVQLGLRTTITPSATPLLTREAVRRIAASGVARMAVSIDDAAAAEHDSFRGVLGSFDRSISALRWASEEGLQTQVNTTVTRHNHHRLESIAALVGKAGVTLWSVFFLIATGRASRADDLTAQEYEDVFAYLYRLSKTSSFDIKTTEAQHYRRFVAEQRKIEGASRSAGSRSDLIARHSGINDGKGLVFISHTGEIYPSGFLPLGAGNVRKDSLTDVYRNHPLFRALRNPSEFSGKCGVCQFRNLCGGSRSRAYALEGDHLGSDPRCVYEPPAFSDAVSKSQEVRG